MSAAPLTTDPVTAGPVSVPLSAPALTPADAERVRRCVADGWVSTAGPVVGHFEQGFAAAIGVPEAVAVASGTAALHLALLAVGVGTGDEVWVSDLTFVASANAARYCGAEVVLVDAERDTWNLDPALVVAELDRRAATGIRQPRAVVAVHVLSHPARLAEVAAACTRHGVALVEDAAEGLGGGWSDAAGTDRTGPAMRRAVHAVGPDRTARSVGTVGDVGCFSFNGNKMLTTGSGGMVVARDPAVLARVRHLSTQARVGGLAYDHDEVGYNYRLAALNAALGLGQLERLAATVSARRAVADRYDAAFAGLVAAGCTLQPDRPWAVRSGWLSALLLADPAAVGHTGAALRAAGIDSRPLWTPLHRLAPYRRCRRLVAAAPSTVAGGSVAEGASVADELADRGLCLPSSADLDPAVQDRIIEVVAARARRSAA